ncbi:MAG: NAD(+) diphosphatase [Spirochaetales bacterium]|nr:NAD(+) diphosphatase [Spirochaetales bacterium]
MIQDIFPSRLDNRYKAYEMRDTDGLFFFDGSGRVLIGGEGQALLPSCADACGHKVVYLFSIDDRRYFLVSDCSDYSKEGSRYLTIREARDLFQGREIFAVFTAWHLWRWYSDNRFCGRCGNALEHDTVERALRCPKCGNLIYPRINPAVIVGVVKGDCLLITRYRNGYSHNALVAGFTEIGETLEQTVEREVMEETGIRVCNIRYYKSQPWGMAQDILTGFFCEADGDDEIRMDENELRYAQWVPRAEIVLQPNNLSLTNEMMSIFKEGKV